MCLSCFVKLSFIPEKIVLVSNSKYSNINDSGICHLPVRKLQVNVVLLAGCFLVWLTQFS